MSNEFLKTNLPELPDGVEASPGFSTENEYLNIEKGISKDDPTMPAQKQIIGSLATGDPQNLGAPSPLTDDNLGVALPLTADDVDLIEKEWVNKAKHIVAMTIGDPFQQNRQLSKVKADYIKKRYSKIIKLSE